MPKGPTPRPAALKLVEGRGNGRDSGGRVVATPPAFVRLPPEPPAWLDEVALAEWERVLPELTRLELTKELDGAALAAYCQTWSLLVASAAEVARDGLTVERTFANGSVRTVVNPAVAVQFKASAQLRSWCAEFGFTPSSEQRLTTTPPVLDDGLNPFA